MCFWTLKILEAVEVWLQDPGHYHQMGGRRFYTIVISSPRIQAMNFHGEVSSYNRQPTESLQSTPSLFAMNLDPHAPIWK